MLRLDLRSPCSNCPFRSDVEPFITKDRILGIVDDLHAERSFECHKTAHPEQKRSADGRFEQKVHQHCAGAMIFLVKEDRTTSLMQVSERLGWSNGFKTSRLSTKVPVFGSVREIERKFTQSKEKL